MSDPIYATVSGATSLEANFEMIANNLANASTVGFKRDCLAFESLMPKESGDQQESFERLFSADPPLQDKEFSSGVNRFIDFSQGAVRQTSIKTDFAINGDGFFKIQNGETVMYTRNGSFAINERGLLVNKNGLPVLGSNGEITITDPDFEVTKSGDIVQYGKIAERIEVVHCNDGYPFEKVGGNLFRLTDSHAEMAHNDHSEILQGNLETSNINVMRGLTELVTVARLYEAYQRNMKNYDHLNSKSANEIAKV